MAVRQVLESSAAADRSRGSTVRLLGSVEAIVDGRPVALGSPKQKCLFALLAGSPGRPVSTARLIEALWRDEPPESAGSALQVYVSRLRRALNGSDDRRAPRIRRQPPGYVLEVGEDDIDAFRFIRLVDAARRRLGDDPLGALSLLDDAFGLVRGEPYADVADLLDDGVAAEMTRLREAMLTARETRLEAHLAIGDSAAAVEDASALVAEQPLRESAYGLLMLALYRTGRQADALARYESLRRDLDAELGADPGPEVRRMHVRILQQDPDLDWRRRAEAPIASRVPPPVDSAVFPRSPEHPEPRAGTELIGREPALGRLRTAWRRTEGGAGSTWLITGEAGIGKTRLVRELAREAQEAGATVARSAAHDTADSTPYWMWAQLLRSLPALVSDSVGVVAGLHRADFSAPLPILQRAAIHAEVAGELVALSQQRPLVLVLDDLHWADPLSLELLEAVARAAASHPLMILASFREVAPAPAPALQDLLGRLARTPAVERLELTGLSSAESERLLGAALAADPPASWVDAAVERAEGNPFYLMELARMRESAPGSDPAAPDSIPSSVRDVVRTRIAGLSPGARNVLEAAAVVGREVQLGLLQQVVGVDHLELDQAIEEAVVSGLIVEHLVPRPGVRFRHALVAEAVYAGLRPLARARLHAAVGTAMASGDYGYELNELAQHLLQGADVVGAEEAVPVLVSAARRASDQVAFEHAEILLREALTLITRMPPGDDRDRVELAVQARLGSAIANQKGQAAPEAEAALQRAYELAAHTEPDEEAIGAIYHHLSWLIVAADFPRALALSEGLLERSAVGGLVGQRLEYVARAGRGLVWWHRGDDESAVTELTSAYRLALVVGPGLARVFTHDPTVPVLSLLAHAVAGTGRRQEALAMSDRALALARQSRPPETAAGLVAAGWLRAWLDQADVTEALTTELLALARQHGLRMYEVLGTLQHSWAVITSRPSDPAAPARLAELRAAYAAYLASGARTFTPMVSVLVAESEIAAGDPEAGSAAARAGRESQLRDDVWLWRDRLDRLLGSDAAAAASGT